MERFGKTLLGKGAASGGASGGMSSAGDSSRVDTADLARRFEELRQLRRPWEGAWRALADHFLPSRYRPEGQLPSGDALLNGQLVDATGVLAMRTLAAGLHGGMSSPARPWFRLAAADPDLARRPLVGAYLDECARRMRALFHRTNFYNALHTVYAELGTFGTAFLFELADVERGFRFVPLSAGEFVLDMDESRRVDTVFRRFRLNARQLARAFGQEALPESLRSALRRGRGYAGSYTVAHAVLPRADVRLAGQTGQTGQTRQTGQEAGSPQGGSWASVYWLEEGGGRHGAGPHLLRSGVFGSFPGFGPRWSAAGNDVYGRSPAMDSLPDCRMLQQMGITMLKAAHKAVDPPMSVSASLKSVGLDLTPGGINYVESAPGQIPQAAAPLVSTRPDMVQTRQAMEAVQKQVKAGLFNDLFRLIMDGRQGVTAREIAAREEEKLLLLGPVLERLHSELFIPLVERTYSLMNQMDMLPPPPPEVWGQPLRVDFVSLLAQAQKLVCTGAVREYLTFAGDAAKAWPEVLDSVNPDAVADSYAEYLGLEAGCLRPQEERETLRRQRAEVQAEAHKAAQEKQSGTALMEGVKTAVESARGLSQIKLEEGTALHALLGAVSALSPTEAVSAIGSADTQTVTETVTENKQTWKQSA